MGCLLKIVLDTADKIRKLEIQGATNVALRAVQSIVEQMKVSESRSRDEALSEIGRARDILFATRETEPFMRNAIRYIEWKLGEDGWESIEELRTLIQGLSDELFDEFYASREHTANVGSKRILPGFTVLTHCHSSAVTMTLRKAAEKGTDFKVICTETRPRYQGRITANELTDAGIDTTMIVDSAVRAFMKKADIVMLGSDAITSEGNVINKIGSSMVATTAHESRIPFYVVSELLKFDPQTIHGEYEAIEERDPSEIWSEAPSTLKIRNPAFDVIRRDHIHGIICEEGIISPHSIIEAIRRRHPWLIKMVN